MTEASYTAPGSFNITVPNGDIIDIECWGASTETAELSNIARGGYIKGRFQGLVPGTPLTVEVGVSDGTGYFAGGISDGTDRGFNGGGGSGVLLNNQVLIVAGGAGGGGFEDISALNEAPIWEYYPGGNGGALIGGISPIPEFSVHGLGGTQSAGGSGGFSNAVTGESGSLNTGGDGAGNAASTGGGGGGGYYGGGGGTRRPGGGFAGRTRAGPGGGGSNGYNLSNGVCLLGPIITLRGGDPAIPMKPGAAMTGAVRITATSGYGYTGSLQPFVVESDVTCLEVELWGADGASSSTQLGGAGGFCSGQIPVTPGETLYLSVGQRGSAVGGAGGLSPGGIAPGGVGLACGGGAGTCILNSALQVIMIAGGGGGASSFTDLTDTLDYPGGAGGGINGVDGGGGQISGFGALSTAPGLGGIGSLLNGESGSGMLGGAGAVFPPYGTGGGGGGLYGGGGGGISTSLNNSSTTYIGSGGGGCSGYDLNVRPVISFSTSAAKNVFEDGLAIVRPVTCVCVGEGTFVEIENGLLPIGSVKRGMFAKGFNGQDIEIHQVAKMKSSSNRIVYCYENCFGPNSPGYSGIFISDSHPIFLNGHEITARELIEQNFQGLEYRHDQNIKLFTLITTERTFVNMNGVAVATWGIHAWQNFINNDRIGQLCKFDYQ